MAGEHGGISEILGDHGLAQAGGPAQDEVAAAREEVEGERPLDQGAIDFLGPIPLELGQGFEVAQAGLRQAAFQAAASPVCGFGVGDFFQQLTRTSAPGGGASQQVVERVGGEEQAEVFQLRYSVPYVLTGQDVEVRSTLTTVKSSIAGPSP
jgi:hypothetical protein